MSILRPEWLIGSDARYEDLYKEALEGRKQICTDIDELRSRVTNSLAAVALTTAVFATLLPKSETPLADQPIVLAAVGSFMATLILWIIILRPRSGWRYAAQIDEMKAHLRKHPYGSRERLRRWHIEDLQSGVKADSHRLNGLHLKYDLGLLFFAAEIVLWLFAILR